MVYDVAIIGAGVVGTLTARELSKYKLNNVLLEKTSDIAMGSTKANSGIVHSGYDAMPGTLMAKYNVKGCRMMEELAKTLHVPYKKNGSLVLAFSDEDVKTLGELYDRGIKNGIPANELHIICREEIKRIEPNINDAAVAALLATEAGIVSPYELAIAAGECAVGNGTEFIRDFPVESYTYDKGVFTITAEDGRQVQAKVIVNAAGLYANELSKKFNGEDFDVKPRLGEYGLMDRSCEGLITHTVFQCPNPVYGKGVLVAPTTHGNIFVGPTSFDMDDPENKSVRVGALSEIFGYARKSVPSISQRDMITSFAGIRSHRNDPHDFVIEKAKTGEPVVNLIGIESPGLASSPAIAEEARKMAISFFKKKPEKNKNFNPGRKAPVFFRTLPIEEKEKLIEENPEYGRIVCRCETVTEGEIRDAIKAPAGATTVDGVKRRTRAGMGRCQGGFCSSRVMEILAEELGKPLNEITKFGGDSDILYERTK